MIFCFSNVTYLSNLFTLCISDVLVVYTVLHYNHSNPPPLLDLPAYSEYICSEINIFMCMFQ